VSESPAKVVGTLTVAGLVSGLAIVSAFQATLPRIQKNQAEALERAVFKVLPGASRMERLAWDGSRLQVAVAGKGELADTIFSGYGADGAILGFAVPAGGPGFQDTIRVIYGLDPAGAKVLGMEVLESRETPGLGDRIYKDEKFVAEFHDLVVEPVIRLIKGHGTAPNEVDAITGATISSTAIVRILNNANAVWRPRLPKPGEAVPSAAAPSGAPSGAPGTAVPPDANRGGPVPGGRLGDKP
jgi:Na+-translocating ferredoxin:NAD+ oxidoreductase subunit G